jgi:hypothetical protein
MTYTRLPGADSTPFAYDGQPMPITRVDRWPAVGGQSLVVFDDQTDPSLEQWRLCSEIRAIAAAPSGTERTSPTGDPLASPEPGSSPE